MLSFTRNQPTPCPLLHVKIGHLPSHGLNGQTWSYASHRHPEAHLHVLRGQPLYVFVAVF
jgi:hypothetical protein